MLLTAKATFPHSHNEDGSHHATCLYCYMTLGPVGIETDLSQLEAIHVCDPVRLDKLTRPLYQETPL